MVELQLLDRSWHVVRHRNSPCIIPSCSKPAVCVKSFSVAGD